MSAPIQFFVPGIPKPGGSKRGFVHHRTGRVIITEDCVKSKDWRATVSLCAMEHCKDLLTGPVQVLCIFYLPRPKGHFRTGRNKSMLRVGAPAYPTTKPDATKLWRSTEDALKGIAWGDDSQVVDQTVLKRFGDRPGAMITLIAPAGAEVER